MKFPIQILIGALMGILLAIVIALGYLTSNGNIVSTVISAVFGFTVIYCIIHWMADAPRNEDKDKEVYVVLERKV